MRIFDAHNDYLTELNKISRTSYVNNISKQKQTIKIVSVIWTTQLNNVEKTINEFAKEIEHKKNLILSIEDLGFINQKNFFTATNLLKKIKPFYCGLVWNYDNTIGGGSNGCQGLTPLGEKVVKTLELNNIIVDTAHMNERTFWDFVKITKKPIFCSHANIYDLLPHRRNLKDKQIREIIKSNGIVCLSFVKYFIDKKYEVTSKDVAKQIKYFVDKYGANNLSIGTDFFGTKELPNDLITYIDFNNLKVELIKQGLSFPIIDKIFYLNLYKFYKNNKK